jgi:hypothetical protein
MSKSYLYRGVSTKQHEEDTGLRPKAPGQPFRTVFDRSGLVQRKRGGPGSGATRKESEINAAILHELNQEGHPTSGVSCTPHLSRALFYATRGGTQDGYVYVLDRARFPACGIMEYATAELVPSPSVPEDEEVIVVAPGGSEIPSDVVVDCTKALR